MNILIYTHLGSHYSVYDDVNKWELIKTYTNFTNSIGNENDPNRISFPPQFTGIGQTRAFYIAIVETYGLKEPMVSSVTFGENYLNGVVAEDGNLKMMEGIKVSAIL
mmetsp:Transcript_31509/g.60113  ORF Transcript_31509/g.60113 Transcript_31509/m.60113 type:complete len:107 (-) Transcript_31509:3325-3645(-)